MKGSFKTPLWGKVLAVTLLCILGGVLCFVLHINIVPYQKLAATILGLLGKDPNSGFGFLANAPVVGDFFGWITAASAYLIGLVIFCLIQAAELASKLIYRIPWITKKVLAHTNASANAPSASDKGVVRRLKSAISNTVLWAVAHLENIRKGAYLIDACVCFAAYPFIKNVKNPFDFLGVIVTAQIDRIDLMALFLFALTVYGVELLLDTIWSVAAVLK